VKDVFQSFLLCRSGILPGRPLRTLRYDDCHFHSPFPACLFRDQVLRKKANHPWAAGSFRVFCAGSHLGRGSRRRESPGDAIFFLWATEPALRGARGKIIAAAGRDSIRGLHRLSVDRADPCRPGVIEKPEPKLPGRGPAGPGGGDFFPGGLIIFSGCPRMRDLKLGKGGSPRENEQLQELGSRGPRSPLAGDPGAAPRAALPCRRPPDRDGAPPTPCLGGIAMTALTKDGLDQVIWEISVKTPCN